METTEICDALSVKIAEESVAREDVPNNRMLMDEKNQKNYISNKS